MAVPLLRPGTQVCGGRLLFPGCIAAIALACFWIATFPTAAHGAGHQEARQLYHSALKLLESGEIRSAIDQLEEAVDAAPDFAAAQAALGNAYRLSGTVQGRIRGVVAAKRAVELEPDNAEYSLNLAKLYIEQDDYYRAEKELGRAIKLDPRLHEAHYVLGRMCEQRWLKKGAARTDRAYLEKGFESFMSAVNLAPNREEYLYHVVLLAHELGHYHVRNLAIAQLDTVGTRLWVSDMLAGAVYADEGEYELAEKEFREAIELMTPEEREALEDPLEIANYVEFDLWRQTEAEDRDEFETRFWGRRDPDPTTKVNERWVEHMRRMVLAEIYYGVPEIGLRGWDTERGDAFIRYGPPRRVVFDPGAVGSAAEDALAPEFGHRRSQTPHSMTYTSESGRMQSVGYEAPLVWVPETEVVAPETWFSTLSDDTSRADMYHAPYFIWHYGTGSDTFNLAFEDVGLAGKFGLPMSSLVPEDKRTEMERIKNLPEIYQYQAGHIISMMVDAAEFRGEEGKSEIRVYYSIEGSDLIFQRTGDLWSAVLERRLIVMDMDWNELHRHSQLIRFGNKQTRLEAEETLYLDEIQFDIEPGIYRLALAVEDEESDLSAFAKSLLTVDPLGIDSLMVSHIVLAGYVEEVPGAEAGAATRFVRSGYRLAPNPSHVFSPQDSLFMFFEIYNLALGEDGRSHYRTRYNVEAFLSEEERERKEGFWSKFWRTITFSREKSHAVATSFVTHGNRPHQPAGLQIGIADLEYGVYEITLEVEDIIAQTTAQREATLFIQ